ncbi:MAG: hypothetical protein JXR48_10280 [Candidatus Delongbacteria bacterium]|nr:hypothetical protein [Candidatus Delongbacteria bacterium]MBN2835342.1 hypothetical protein [Candidatus Delongbacteria bacterium]
MLDLIASIVKLPWTGAKVILSALTITVLFTTGDVVFEKPTLNEKEDLLIIDGILRNSLNEKVEKLLFSSTPIKIVYTINDDNNTHYKEYIYSYDPFNKTILKSGDIDTIVISVSDNEDIREEFETYSIIINNSQKINELTITADISIISNDKNFQNISLWKEKPQIHFKIGR